MVELIEEHAKPAEIYYQIRWMAKKAWSESGNEHPYEPDLDMLYHIYELGYLHVYRILHDKNYIGYAIVAVMPQLFSTYNTGDVWSLYLEPHARKLGITKAVMKQLKAACSKYCDEIVIHRPFKRHHGEMGDLRYNIKVR